MSDFTRSPRIGLTIVKRTLVGVIFAVIIFSLGYYFGYKGYVASGAEYPKVTISRVNPELQKELDFTLFWKVWDSLHAKYYDKSKVIDSELVYGAIRGMVAAVGDPYTVFLSPKQNKIVEEDLQGSFEGVGIQIGFKRGELAVIAPLPDSPAEKVGVRPGDYIVEIKDEGKGIDMGTVGISLEEAVEAIRGKANTIVKLTLIRDGEDQPLNVDITRSPIDVPSLVVKYIDDSDVLVHVKLIKFSAETLAEWDTTVADLLKNPNLAGIVFDVRNNPGGYLQGAVDLASDFLESGDLVVKEAGGLGINNEYKVVKLGRLKNINMAVLINEGSASASEIFAGAMKDHGRAKLVGDKTFGKGTIQEPEQVDGGAGLHITVAKWLTPDGVWVHDTGLEPDVFVANNPDTEEDEQLQKAIELLNNQLTIN